MAWTVELSAEVNQWYRNLNPADRSVADRSIERLARLGNQLRMPHSKALGQGLYELRFTCRGVARRVTYVFEPQRRVFTLTTFRKQRQNERAEILRARRAQGRRTDEAEAPASRDSPRTPRKPGGRKR